MRAAFTLNELLVVVAIIAIVAAIVLPSMGNADRLRVMAAADLLISDIEYAQTLTIVNPGVPIVVVFDEPNASYHLARADSSDIPLVRPDTNEPYAVTFGVGRGASAEGVSMTVDPAIDDMIVFTEMGSPANAAADITISVHSPDHSIDVIISASTGMIRTKEVMK